MLSLSGLSICRGNFEMSLPTLNLKEGEVLAIQGSSGCGKSTLLEIIGLILKPDYLSHFELDGVDITQEVIQQKEKQLAVLRSHYFGFMLQSGGLLPFLTVQENLALSCQLIGKQLDKSWQDDLIDRLSISHLLRKYPKQLSIGERQRVSFLRAISHRPKLLLADEPTAALDPYNAAKLFDIIVDLVQENQLSALIVTHDWELAKARKMPILSAQLEAQKAVFHYQVSH